MLIVVALGSAGCEGTSETEQDATTATTASSSPSGTAGNDAPTVSVSNREASELQSVSF